MKASLEQTVGIAQEQTIKGQKEGGLPPPVGIFHGYNCFCEDCRRYITVEDGEVKEKTKRIVTADRRKTLDCTEYIVNKRVNKFRDSAMFMRGVEDR
tara:strand:+ start:114 stop:404 length:291 start_codon:yes stop_codon:yes gene_type:complete